MGVSGGNRLNVYANSEWARALEGQAAVIQKLDDSHRTLLADFLQRAPEQNIYMLGNLSALGVDHPISEFWGDLEHVATGSLASKQVDSTQQTPLLRGVLNRYMRGWSVYGESTADWSGLAAVLDNHPEPAERLQDNPGGISTFTPWLRRYHTARREVEELMALAAEDFKPCPAPSDVTVRAATLDDLEALAEFYAQADSMRRSRAAVERPLRDGHVWLAEHAGTPVSAALTNALGAGYAMIGGVYTPPAWRGRGLAQAVCSGLCAALLAAGLIPALYWIANDAGHIYHKLGFRPIGSWTSVWLAPVSTDAP